MDPTENINQVKQTALLNQHPDLVSMDKMPDTIGSASRGLTSGIPATKSKPNATYKIDPIGGMVVPKDQREGGTIDKNSAVLMQSNGKRAWVYPDKSYKEI